MCWMLRTLPSASFTLAFFLPSHWQGRLAHTGQGHTQGACSQSSQGFGFVHAV
jgi:hypothetical protein